MKDDGGCFFFSLFLPAFFLLDGSDSEKKRALTFQDEKMIYFIYICCRFSFS